MPVQTTPQTKQKTYTQEEAFEASNAYFKGDELAARVWINKYALKDSEGNLYKDLTPISIFKTAINDTISASLTLTFKKFIFLKILCNTNKYAEIFTTA